MAWHGMAWQCDPSPLWRAPEHVPHDYEFPKKPADISSCRQIDLIDKKTYEIRQDDEKVVYKSLQEIADDLPDNSPRYILLSYPLTLVPISRFLTSFFCTRVG